MLTQASDSSDNTWYERLVETTVDMVETFNYLIGLNVITEKWYQNDKICVVQGTTTRERHKTLVIWRNCKEIHDEELCDFYSSYISQLKDCFFDVIYVNGDNSLSRLRNEKDQWKIVLTEQEFQKRMFDEG